MSSQKPDFFRQKTALTRDFLAESLTGTEMSRAEIRRVLDACTFGRRVDPLVDIDSHGKPDVARNLRKQGIMDQATEERIYGLVKNAKRLVEGKKEFERLRVLFVNATEFGGGVAEMRPNNARFLKEFGVDGDWAVIDGCEAFYQATVHIHEGIQNPHYAPLARAELEVLAIVSVLNFARFDALGLFAKYDAIWLDDPQPLGMLPMIKAVYPDKPVIWRCHVHCTPEPSIRAYLAGLLEGRVATPEHGIVRQFMLEHYDVDFSVFEPAQLRADCAVFHLREFSDGMALSPDIPVHIMGPAIDPLSFKNMPVSQEFILATLAHYGVVQAKKHDEQQQMRAERKLAVAKGVEYQMRLNRRLSVLEGYASEKECLECASESSGEDSDWAYAVPPYVVEVSRYDPYKGPFEVVVAFIEAMRTLDPAAEGMRFILKNCRFVYAASTPGDNPTGAQILRNLKLFIRNVDVLKTKELCNVKNRIFLLSLKDQRRTELLRKRIFDKIWDREEHKKEIMVNEVLMHNAVAPLSELIFKLTEGSEPLISDEVAADLLGQGELMMQGNLNAYFTVEQMETMADSIRGLRFGDANIWAKVKNNYLSGKEINHLEVNALQTGAIVRCQFSSKEGFGLVVAEAMVKLDKCSPPVNGLMAATTVGGVKSQVREEVALPVQYPPEEVDASLRMYTAMRETHVNSVAEASKLYREIAARRSVQDFAAAIKAALAMPKEDRELKNRLARNFILSNFSIHSNVVNILRAVELVLERKAAGGGA